MKKFSLTAVVLLAFLAIGLPTYAAYRDKKEEATPSPAAQPPAGEAAKPSAEAMPGMTEEQMAKMKEFMTPNENHRVLDYFVGNWDYSMKWWMKPDAPPEESTGTSEAKWVLDGRFLEENVHGMSMGQPFEGLMLVGFDNAKKVYNNIWLDNMGTGIMTSTATYDVGGKTFWEKGSHSCPITEGGEKNYRAQTVIKDDDHYTYEWFTSAPDDPAGKEFKAMEINYTRKKI